MPTVYKRDINEMSKAIFSTMMLSTNCILHFKSHLWQYIWWYIL